MVYATSSPVCYLFRILVPLPIFMFFMIFHLILPVLLTPNNYCFHNQVIPFHDLLGVVDQTFTKLSTVIVFRKIWSQPNMASVFFLYSRKYGLHQAINMTSWLFFNSGGNPWLVWVVEILEMLSLLSCDTPVIYFWELTPRLYVQ